MTILAKDHPPTDRPPAKDENPQDSLPTLIERLAASHAAVLEKWHRNFALDLRRPKQTTLVS
jgi:hypothetical protein